jgi:hypothetical protein
MSSGFRSSCYWTDWNWANTENIRIGLVFAVYYITRIGDQTIFNTWKNNKKKCLQCTLQTSHINETDKNKLELIRNNI